MAGDSEWRGFVAAQLQPYSAALTEVLRTLAGHDYPAEVAAIDFEIFPDGFTEGFPVHALFKDAKGEEVFVMVDGVARCPAPVDPDLLELECVYDEEAEEAFELDQVDRWVAAADELAIWFARCWSAAGGEALTLRASIHRHDDPDSAVALPTAV